MKAEIEKLIAELRNANLSPQNLPHPRIADRLQAILDLDPVTVWHKASEPPDTGEGVLVTDGKYYWVTPYRGEWHHGPARNYPTHWVELPELPEADDAV